MRNLEILVWIGAALAVAGLIGIGWCIMAAQAARRDLHDEARMRARMQRIVSVNMGALMASLVGLMLVAAGVFLGR